MTLTSASNESATSREVKLLSHPEGLPLARHFAIATTPAPRQAAGEVLVRNLYFRVSASVRMMISAGATSVPGVPFPALHIGDTLAEEALGEVIAAPTGSMLSPGDLVVHPLGWRELAAVPESDCFRVDDTLPDRAAHLSHGWTAYAVLTRGAALRAGETVFISSAAGAIGSMAGQIARLLGAGKVIGSTRSPGKAARLGDIGYDHAIVENGNNVRDQLARAAPDGLDLYIDNVGGAQLTNALKRLRDGGRVVIAGALSGQLAESGSGRTCPTQIDTFQVLLKHATIRGYSADNDGALRSEWTPLFAEWLRQGQIKFPYARISGIENAPRALEDVAHGRLFGAVIVEV
jgi:2-alkenal reductase